MTTRHIPILLLLCLFAAITANSQDIKVAQPPATTNVTVLERGLNHKVVQTESGGTYTVLADGLCYEENGVLKDSEDIIELARGGNGAVATKGRHKAAFPPSITSPVTLTLPDGSSFVARPFCIAYFDSLTGDSVLVAELADSIGELHPPNQVIYPRAFPEAGADVRYTWRKGGFAQDIIIRSRLPDAALWNFDPAFTRLECWSEILDSPAIAKTTEILSAEQDPDLRLLMAAPDVIDETLDLGATMKIGRGKAFPIDDADTSIPVSKQLITVDGRRFLIETIEYTAADPILKTLPAADQAHVDRWKQRKPRARAELIAAVRPQQPEQRAEARTIQLAKNVPTGPALVADYDVLYNASYTDFTFAADRTYSIGGIITLAGTTTLESAVIKFPPYNVSYPAYIKISGTGAKINCITAPYRPAIFTAHNDNTVGETVSTGTPSGYYATCAVYFDSSAANESFLHDIRIRFANTAIYYSSGTSHILRHSQLVSCNKGFEGSPGTKVQPQNALLSAYQLLGGYIELRGQNVTISAYTMGSSSVYLTNSLYTFQVPASPYGINNASVTSSAFAPAVGAGSKYLADNSSHRNAGTIAIQPDLLADLRKRTTFAPEIKNSDFTSLTILQPRPIKDADDTAVINDIDLGYHYDVLDYAWSGRTLTSTLLLTNGVAVAHYGTRGTTLGSGAVLISEGAPLQRNVIVPYMAVQDNVTAWGTLGLPTSILNIAGAQPTTRPKVYLRFTDISFPADVLAKRHLFDNANAYTCESISVRDCEFTAVYFNTPILPASSAASLTIIGLTNNLFRRVNFAFRRDANTPVDAHLFNNLFINSTLGLLRTNTGGTQWRIQDNLFDSVTLTAGTAPLTKTYNGYLNSAGYNAANNDKQITARDYQATTSLGTNYYLTSGGNLSQLLNAGSRTASAAGLAHFTTTGSKDQGQVDIGYHFVALSGSQSSDSDQDGKPDYLEDPNGNGLTDTGESSWSNPVIAFAATPMNYPIGWPGQIIDASATVVDADSPNVANGQLSVSFSLGAHSDDRLTIRNWGTQANQVGTNNVNDVGHVTYGGVDVGTFVVGIGTTPLQITFNANANIEAVQAMLTNLCFHSALASPLLNQRTIQAVLTDGHGGSSAASAKTINVSACPTKVDTVLLLDVSNSLNQSPNGIAFVHERMAATQLVAQLSLPLLDRGGLVTFCGTASRAVNMTTDESALRAGINVTTTCPGTRFDDPINEARAMLFDNPRTDAAHLIFLMTDGQTSYSTEAQNAASRARELGIRLVTLGFGTHANIDTDLLESMATRPSDFFREPYTALLRGKVSLLAKTLCRDNLAPVVTISAPSQIAIDTDPTAELSGWVGDDGVPEGVSFTTSWSVASGPGPVTLIPNPISSDPWEATATFSRPGVYQILFTASDTIYSGSATATITVTKQNAAPIVSAGPNQTIDISDRVYLPGTATDDDQPSPPGKLTFAWSRTGGSGLGEVIFDNAGASNTMATFTQAGTYELRLQADDGVLSGYDTVTIVVKNEDHQVFAGVDYFSAGVGGMKGIGTGTIKLDHVELDNPSTSIRKAYLYWHGPTDVKDPNANASVLVNGRLVVGKHLGFAYHNNWRLSTAVWEPTSPLDNKFSPVLSPHRYDNSQSYRADITGLVREYRKGDYNLEKFTKGPAVNVNGASIIVLYNDDNGANDRDVILVEANESNGIDSSKFFADHEVKSVVLQPHSIPADPYDIILGGWFNEMRDHIARMNDDGSVETTFIRDSGIDGPVFSIARQTDGKLIIAGDFVKVAGQPHKRIARLDPNGNLDPLFNAGDGADFQVNCVVIQSVDSEERIVAGGKFTRFNNDTTRKYLVRLNPSGTLDTSFTPPPLSGDESEVLAIAKNSASELYVGGRFDQRIVRLHPNGTLDSTFNASTIESHIGAVAVQSDGLVLVGIVARVDGEEEWPLIRLNSNGNRDSSFAPQVGQANDSTVTAITLWENPSNQSDRSIYIGGKFTSINGDLRNHLAKLNNSGALSPGLGSAISFAPTPVTINSIAITPDRSVIVGGEFFKINGLVVDNVARFSPQGAFDTSFISSERGWRLTTPNFTYGPNSHGHLELHVSDGQHRMVWNLSETLPPKVVGYVDAPVYVNENATPLFDNFSTLVCGQHQPANPQVFQGDAPSAHWVCAPVAYSVEEIYSGNANLWDIREEELPTLGSGDVNVRITADPLPANDYVSLVVAALKLSLGSAYPNLSPPAERPAELPPVMRDDVFTVHRHLGARVLDVLQNDTTAREKLINITSVSTPARGSARIVYASSAILYEPDPSYAGSDPVEFTYTILDNGGRTGTANVTVSYAAFPNAAPLACGEGIQSLLDAEDALSLTRGDGQEPHYFAEYYKINGTSGLRLWINIIESDVNLHFYLRDPEGWLVAASAHGEFFQYAFSATGSYILEVTSHDPEESGAYELDVTCTDNGVGIDILVDGVVIPDPGVIDLGFLGSKTIQIRNNEDQEFQASLNVLSAITGAPKLYYVSPSSLPISSKSTRSIHVGLVDFTPGQKENLLTISGVSSQSSWQRNIQLRGFVGHNVYPPRPDSGPLAIEDTAYVTVGTSQRIDVLANDYHSDGDPFEIVSVASVSGGPPPSIIEGGKAVLYTAPPGVYGQDGFVYRIRDRRNQIGQAQVLVHIVHQSVSIVAPEDDQRFEIMPLGSDDIQLAAQAQTSFGAITKVEFSANGVKIGESGGTTQSGTTDPKLYRFDWKPKANGFYKIVAVSVDDNGIKKQSAPIIIGVNKTGPLNLPVVTIDNLADDQIVRQGMFQVRGSVIDPDPDPNVKYRLDLWKPTPNYDVPPPGVTEPDPFRFIRNVTPQPDPQENGYHVGGVSSGGELATVDFTGVPNGSYVLRLTAENAFAEASTEVRFILDSQVKVGQLTFSEQDLVIPVAGIPITVVRTYDSLNGERGTNFGPGWSLAINDLAVEFDEERKLTPADPDIQNEDLLPMRVGGGRNITLTLPDGRRATFAFTLVPGTEEDCFCLEAKWKAPPNVFATLVPKQDNRLQFIPYQPGDQEAIGPYWEAAGPQVPFESFDFNGFYLTNVDGSVYEISRPEMGLIDLHPAGSMLQQTTAFGRARVTNIHTPAGDRIEIGDTTGTLSPAEFEIKHFTSGASPQTHTTRILIQRDNKGRISKIYDPIALGTEPLSEPVVTYHYYGDEPNDHEGIVQGGSVVIAVPGALGNLKSVKRMVKRRDGPIAPLYETTAYYYRNQLYPHLITDVVNHRGDHTHMEYTEARFTGASLLQGVWPNESSTELMSLNHDITGRREVTADGSGNRAIHEYDERGNVVRSIDPFGASTSRSFDSIGQLRSETDSFGNTTKYEYDEHGNRTEIKDALQNRTQFTYNRFGQVLNTYDPKTPIESGPTSRNVYDEYANLTSSEDALGTETTYLYDEVSRRLLRVTDALGNITTNIYYALGQTGGRSGDLKEVLVRRPVVNPPNPDDPFETLSRTVYEYDLNGNRTKETIKSVLPPGQGIGEDIITTYEYDAQNRLVKTTDALGGSSETIYNSLGKVEKTIDRYGRETEYEYDSRGNLSHTTYPDDSIVRMWYDANNRLTIRSDQHFAPENNETTPTNYTRTIYDPLGRSIRTERVKVEWINNATYVETVVSSTATEYDAVGRTVASIDARGYATIYGYDTVGRRITVKNALGEVTRFAYDANGNQQFVTNALGPFTEYEYDKLNRRTKTKHPQIGAAQSTIQETRYDVLGRRIAEIDADGVTTGFGYDALGRLTSVTNDFKLTGSPFVTTYAYDEVGNMRRQTDANNNSTTFKYDKLGRRTERTLPENPGDPPLTEETYYGSANEQTVKIVNDFKNQRLFYLQDKMDRLIAKGTLTGGDDEDWLAYMNPIVEFTYLVNGLRATMKDAASKDTPFTPQPTSYEYDEQNRLKKKNFSLGRYQGSLEYQYDGNGNVTEIQGDNTMHYAWDPANRLTKVLKSDGSGYPMHASYTYDAAGNLDEMLYATGLKHTYALDEMNRLTSVTIKHGTTDKALFIYGPLPVTGQRTIAQETMHHIDGSLLRRNVSYEYDTLRRLTKEAIDLLPENLTSIDFGGAFNYGVLGGNTSNTGLDLVGNRRSREVTWTEGESIFPLSSFTEQEYDANDRLRAHTADPEPDHDDAYDANGNTLRGLLAAPNLGGPAATVTIDDQYDFENRLVHRTVTDFEGTPTAHIGLFYDGDGNRVKKAITNIMAGVVTEITEIYYVVDDRNPTGYAQVVQELTSTPGSLQFTPTRQYVYGHKLISQTAQPSGTTHWYGYDGHGSVRFLANDAGQVTDIYTYDAYGNIIGHTPANANELTPNNYLYAGEQFDPDLGLYYNRARYYNPQTGRFWTMDTHEGNHSNPLSLHKYLYAHANPIHGHDPTGMAFREINSNFELGREVEEVVARDFRLQRNTALHNRSIHRILDRFPGYKGDGRLRPDLVDIDYYEVYDVKSWKETPEGITKVALYVKLLQSNLNPSSDRNRWHAGTTYRMTDPIFQVPGYSRIYAQVFPPVSGAIPYKLYEVDSDDDRRFIPIPVTVPDILRQTERQTRLEREWRIAPQYAYNAAHATAIVGAGAITVYALNRVAMVTAQMALLRF